MVSDGAFEVLREFFWKAFGEWHQVERRFGVRVWEPGLIHRFPPVLSLAVTMDDFSLLPVLCLNGLLLLPGVAG